MSQQYLDLCNRIINEGVWVDNARTGKRCLTVINADFEYDCSQGALPMLTTRKTAWKMAVAEMLGYIKGLSNAADFRDLGTTTWDANANAPIWQDNYHCEGKDDMGRVYGVQGRSWNNFNRTGFGHEHSQYTKMAGIDQLKKVYENLKNGIDDRGEIITYWNVSELNQGCLRPCMYSHTFSLLGDTLQLTSYQRSDDVPLGHVFNQVQVAWFLMVMAKITGHKAGTAYHKIINAHIYEDQLEPLKEQLTRTPFDPPKLFIDSSIRTLEDLENSTLDDYEIYGYEHHPAIKFEFSV